MKEIEKSKLKPDYEICKCSCHIKGVTTMHFMACCEYTYMKYLNIDGSVDIEAYKKITGIKIS
jgi:hypothetical protein